MSAAAADPTTNEEAEKLAVSTEDVVKDVAEAFAVAISAAADINHDEETEDAEIVHEATAIDTSNNVPTTPATNATVVENNNSSNVNVTTSSTQPRILVNGVDITLPHPDWVGKVQAPFGGKRRSPWWSAYHYAVDSAGKQRGICNLCGRNLSLAGGGGTSSLARHLRSHKQAFDAIVQYFNMNLRDYDIMKPYENAVKRKADDTPSENDKKRSKKSRPTPEAVKAFKNQDKKQKDEPVERMPATSSLELTPQMSAPTTTTTGKLQALKAARRSTMLFMTMPNRDDYYSDFVSDIVEAYRTRQTTTFTATEINEEIQHAAATIRETIKAELSTKEAINLVVEYNDCTQHANEFYFTLSAYWVDSTEFTLQSAVLYAQYILSNNSEDCTCLKYTLGEMKTLVVDSWGLSDKIKIILTSNRNSTIIEWAQELAQQCHAQHVMEFDLQTVANVAITKISDDVDDANQAQNVTSALFAKLQRIVDFFNTFPKEQQVLSSLLDLHKCNCTGELHTNFKGCAFKSWWETMYTIEFFLSIASGLQAYISDREDCMFTLSSLDWENLQDLKTLLQPLKLASQSFQQKNKESISSLSPLVPFIVYCMHRELDKIVGSPGIKADDDNVRVASVAKSMIDEFHNVFGSKISEAPYRPNNEQGVHQCYFFAHALDPRFKTLRNIIDGKNKQQLWDALLEDMVKLGEDSKGRSAVDNDDDDETVNDDTGGSDTAADTKKDEKAESKATVAAEFGSDTVMAHYAALYDTEDVKVEKKTPLISDWRQQCITELAQYRDEDCNPKCVHPIHDWWQYYKVRFPTLWRLAQRYLALPVLTARPKRAYDVLRCDQKPRADTFVLSDASLLYENLSLLQNVDCTESGGDVNEEKE